MILTRHLLNISRLFFTRNWPDSWGHGIVSHSMKYIFVWSQWSLPHAWDLRKYAFAPLFLVGATSFIGLVLLEAKTAFWQCFGCTVSEASRWVERTCDVVCVCVCGLSVLWHFNIHNILSPKKRSCHQHIVRKSFPQLFCVFGGFGECLRGFGVVCSWKIYTCQSCDLMRFEGDMKTNIILYRSFLFNIYIYLHIYNILSQRYL